MDRSLHLLWCIVEGLGISVRYQDLHSRHPEWDAYAWPAGRLIVLDRSLSSDPRREKCVLAEEVGHILYPPAENHFVYHVASKYAALGCWERNNLGTLVVKDERLALEWATSFLIPDKAFWGFAAKGPHFWDEWLDRFNVEGWFMRAKFEFMWQKKPFRWADLVVVDR